MAIQEEELRLKNQHSDLYKEKLRLKEKKMGQQFALLTQQIELQRKQLDLQLSHRE